MRYLIIRRRIRATLLAILSIAFIISVLPVLYNNAFIREKYTRYYLVENNLNFSQFIHYDLSGSRINKDVSLDLNFYNNGFIASNIRLENLDINGIRLSADIFSKGKFIRDKKGLITGFSGKLFSRNIVLNSKPFKNASMSFTVVDNELVIEYLRFGKTYFISGKVGLSKPFEIELRSEIRRADIKDFTLLIKSKRLETALAMINGFFEINGTLSNLYTNGIIQSRNGKFGRIEYTDAYIRVEGFGPIINIVDSRVKWGDSTLRLNGYVDLRDVGKGSLFKGIDITSDMKALVWEGWDISKKGRYGLSMKKAISDDISVGFKSMAREPLTTYEDREKPEEMSLEYKLNEDENIKMRLKDNEEFLGIEHSIKF